MTTAPPITQIPVPPLLQDIPSPPAQLYHIGTPLGQLLERPRVAIVGSRKFSPYGAQVTADLVRKLAEQGIVIISGLALGIDGIAHRAALEAGGLTIAVLPSPLDDIAPADHQGLARQIVEQGGALVSEYPTGAFPAKQNFIARNRLMSGLAQAVLVTEATENSGTRHTARFAREQHRDLMAVPGNITSAGSVGTNNMLKEGALFVTSYEDVLFTLQLQPHSSKLREVRGSNRNEQTVLDLLVRGVNDGDQLLTESKLDVSQFNQVLTMLEISGKIRPLGMNHWGLV